MIYLYLLNMLVLFLIINLLPNLNAQCSQGESLYEHAGFTWNDSIRFIEDSRAYLDLNLLPLGKHFTPIALVKKDNLIEFQTLNLRQINENFVLFGGASEGYLNFSNRIEPYHCESCQPDTYYVAVFGESTIIYSFQENSQIHESNLGSSKDLLIWSDPYKAGKIFVAQIRSTEVVLYHSSDSARHLILADERRIPRLVSAVRYQVGSTTYLAVGSENKDYGGKMTVFQIIQDELVSFQTLWCQGASLLTTFVLGGDHFLVAGKKQGAFEDPVIIFKLAEGYFIPFQQLFVDMPTKILATGSNEKFLLVISTEHKGLITFQYDGWKFIETKGEPSLTEIVSIHQSFSIAPVTILRATEEGTKILNLHPKFKNHKKSWLVNCRTFENIMKITSEISSIFSTKTKVKFTGFAKSDISLKESYSRVASTLTKALRKAGVRIRITSDNIQNMTNISPHHEVLQSVSPGATTLELYGQIQNLIQDGVVPYGIAYANVFGVNFFEPTSNELKVNVAIASVHHGIQETFFLTDQAKSTVALLTYNEDTASVVQFKWNETEKIFQKSAVGSFSRPAKYAASVELLSGRGFVFLEESDQGHLRARIYKLDGDDLIPAHHVIVKHNTSFVLGVPVGNENCFLTVSQEKCDIFCPESRTRARDLDCGLIKEAQMIPRANSTDIMILKDQKPATELLTWNFSTKKLKFLLPLRFEAGIDYFTTFKDGRAAYIALLSDKRIYIYRKYYDAYSLMKSLEAEKGSFGTGPISTEETALYYFHPLNQTTLENCHLSDNLPGQPSFITLKCNETHVISSISFSHK